MKKSISIWSFQESDVRKCINLAFKAGFQGIELALDSNGDVALDTSEEQLLLIKKEAADSGIQIHSVASGLYWDYSFTSNVEDERKKAYEIAVCQIRTAKILGADSVLIIPGAVGVDFMKEREVIPYDTAYERALAAFQKLKAVAEEYEIQVGIENVWNKFLVSPLEMRTFIDQIDSPFVGSYFDVGNVVFNGYPEHWIKILGDRIKKVHFKDYRREAGGLCGFVDLLAGDVDWKGVMQAFEKIGYDGWCTAEMLPPYSQYSDQIIYNTSASMERIFRKE
ncbi:sugar phosphate isomerase/epimerase family protein [Robinsoniella sp. KNHs210]|uniref:sugar phosphate isomerase/epimerase family protein n=1 Tax=Robinsoniella sp. KNHs210 TaxID=1469950 RepID=UPI000481F02E|nr:sugar phosphate isomerase/epimerase family protein [Robinsoniella sp. KNHs210]